MFSRGVKNHRPYNSDDEMKEALNDLLDNVTAQLPHAAGDATETAAITAQLKHIRRTLELLGEYGHILTFKYHKAVVRAMRERPPSYDPAVHGSLFMTAYVLVLMQSEKKRAAFKPAAARPAASTATRPAKRPRQADICDQHPNGSHTKSECRGRQDIKRPAPVTGT